MAQAEITINNSRNSTNPNGSNSNAEVIRELKGLNSLLLKQFSLQGAGLLGNAGSGLLSILKSGVAEGVLLGLATIAADKALEENKRPGGISGGAPGYNQADYKDNPNTSFVKEYIDGETKVAEVNDLTGEIIRYLNDEQVVREGILDDLGNIKNTLFDSNSKYQELNAGLERWRGLVIRQIISIEDANRIIQSQQEIEKEIEQALKDKLAAIKRSGGSVSTRSGGSISADSVFAEGALRVTEQEHANDLVKYSYKQYFEPLKIGNLSMANVPGVR